MHTYTISKIKTQIEKDPNLGIVSKMVTYQLDHDEIKNISMLGSIAHVFPDQVEIRIVDTNNKDHIINSITYVINQIAPKEYTVNKCPLCGSQLLHFVNTHVCVNIGCLNDEKHNKSIVCLKMLTLFPTIPTNIITNTLNELSGVDTFGVLDVIKYIKDKHKANPDDADMVFTINAMHALRLENLFAAALGGVFTQEIHTIMKHYDNSLIKVLDDLDMVFENLYHMCDERLRIIMTIVLRVNKNLLDLTLL